MPEECRRVWGSAPQEWATFGLPLENVGDAYIRTEWVVTLALDLLSRGTRPNDTDFGAVLHWAHILKALQGSDGLWPTRMHGKTGAAACSGRTEAPIRLFMALRDIMGTTEYDQVIARSKGEGETYGIQDGNDHAQSSTAEQT
ncbi:MAG: hypothetical protein ACP5VE_06685 [Chthonomonadales bacterium]